MQNCYRIFGLISSVLDPDPPDPHVFGPPRSDPDPLVRGMDPDPAPDPSYHQAKIVRKTSIPTAWFDFYM